MKFILDVSKWRCGGDEENKVGEGETQLLNEQGYMCCLGQFSEQCGVAREKLKGIGVPSELEVSDLPFVQEDGEKIREWDEEVGDYTLVDYTQYHDNTLGTYAMSINDDNSITTEKRIEKLKDLFGRHGHEIEVINLKSH